MHAIALNSLRLIGFPVEQGAERMKAEIINGGIGSISGSRVGFYILGAMATCQDPQNFHDVNLVRALQVNILSSVL